MPAPIISSPDKIFCITLQIVFSSPDMTNGSVAVASRNLSREATVLRRALTLRGLERKAVSLPHALLLAAVSLSAAAVSLSAEAESAKPDRNKRATRVPRLPPDRKPHPAAKMPTLPKVIIWHLSPWFLYSPVSKRKKKKELGKSGKRRENLHTGRLEQSNITMIS